MSRGCAKKETNLYRSQIPKMILKYRKYRKAFLKKTKKIWKPGNIRGFHLQSISSKGVKTQLSISQKSTTWCLELEKIKCLLQEIRRKWNNYQNIRQATRIPWNWYSFLLYLKVPKDHEDNKTLTSPKTSIWFLQQKHIIIVWKKLNEPEKNT